MSNYKGENKNNIKNVMEDRKKCYTCNLFMPIRKIH